MFYKSKDLSHRLKINLAKWKRWVREFLPPDPLGGLQSGYARQLNLREVFKVYLGGHLVSTLKFSVPQAKLILSDLGPWLRKNGFFNLQWDQWISAADTSAPHMIYIIESPRQELAYVIRTIRSHKTSNQGRYCQQTLTQTVIKGNDYMLTDITMPSVRVLSLTHMANAFMDRLKP